MGTGFEVSATNEENVGIVPRAVRQLFDGIAKRQEEARESGTMTNISLKSPINCSQCSPSFLKTIEYDLNSGYVSKFIANSFQEMCVNAFQFTH